MAENAENSITPIRRDLLAAVDHYEGVYAGYMSNEDQELIGRLREQLQDRVGQGPRLA